MTVKVVKPIKVTDATLTSSTIPEPDPAQGEQLWVDRTSKTLIDSSNTYYAVFDSVDTDTGFIYCAARSLSLDIVFFKIDKSDGSISYITGTATGFTLSGAYDINTGKIFYGSDSGSTITILDTDDDSITTQAVGSGDQSLDSVVSSNGYAWFCGDAAQLLRYRISNNTWTYAGVGPGGSYTTRSITQASDGLLYVGCSNGKIYTLNPDPNSLVTTEFIDVGGDIRSLSEVLEGVIYATNDNGEVIKIDVANASSSVIKKHLGGNIINTSHNEKVFGYEYNQLLSPQKTAFIEISSESIIDYGPTGGTGRGLEVLDDNVYLFISNTDNNTGDLMEAKLPFSIGDESVYAPNHKIYKATKFTIDDPLEGVSKIPPSWTEVGVSNRYSMFDTFIKNKTKSASDFTVEITPTELYDTVAFFGMSGVENVRVEVIKDDLTVVYDETFNVIDLSSIIDHYTYAFYQLAYIDDFVVKDLPPFLNSTLRLTFEGSDMEVGVAPFGFGQDMGVTVVDTSSNTLDYSRQEFDEFGNLDFVERPVVSYNTYEVDVSKVLAQGVERKLKSLMAENAVWVGDIGDGQSLLTYGRYERSPVTYSNTSIVSYQVKVRGSI